MFGRLRQSLHPLFRRVPAIRDAALTAIDIAARPLLFPFRLDRPVGLSADEARALEASTDRLNAAAEQYFRDYPDPQHLVDKPFSEPEALPRRLIDLGVLFESMRLRPGDVVVELGAGTCWVSHLLNLYGCRTISVDVSPTALALGRRVFERDPRTRWDLNPQFVPYDGHRLPLPDRSVDRVVVYDAYHHLPNPRQVLHELRRVLAADGIVAMSEPGRGHTESSTSQAEAATGVLENELALEQIADQALASGFTSARVAVASHTTLAEVDAWDLRSFMGGRGFARYWKSLCAELDGHHYVLLYAGDPTPTTDRPRRLKAWLAVGTRDGLSVRAGEPARTTVNIFNAGDTVWSSNGGERGWTRIGAHLYRSDQPRRLVDYDWARWALPHDVAPGQRLSTSIDFPPIVDAGRYVIALDLVIEGVAWFADRGSPPLEVACEVHAL